MQRWVPALLAVPVAGCGTSAPRPAPQPAARGKPAGSVFDGTTSQGLPLRLLRQGAGVQLKLRLNLACRDGSSIRGATIDNKGRPARLKAGGAFYVQEKGRIAPTVFRGYGPGPYRWAVSGRIAGASARGTAAFRVGFRDTKCKAVKVTWTARKG